jgi:hypothetical protein
VIRASSNAAIEENVLCEKASMLECDTDRIGELVDSVAIPSGTLWNLSNYYALLGWRNEILVAA